MRKSIYLLRKINNFTMQIILFERKLKIDHWYK